MHCSLTLKQSSLTQQRSLLLACLVSFRDGSCRTLARPEQQWQCDLSCVSCRAAGLGGTHSHGRRPAPCTFLLSAPGPTHCSQPLVTWLVGELSTPTLGKYTPTPSSQLALLLPHFSRTWTVLERSWTHYHVIWKLHYSIDFYQYHLKSTTCIN